jgi:hypothetical protein
VKPQNGQVLLQLLLVILALVALSFVVLQQLEISQARTHHQTDRTQLLWLARSAATARAPGSVAVKIDSGSATVKTAVSGRSVTATARSRRGSATVKARFAGTVAVAWEERFDAR